MALFAEVDLQLQFQCRINNNIKINVILGVGLMLMPLVRVVETGKTDEVHCEGRDCCCYNQTARGDGRCVSGR